jgi:hypothetical protein
VTTCAGCHEGKRPAGHYTGDCSQCHKQPGVSWSGAVFNHSAIGGTDCSACHASRAPANHFPAPCARCHNQPGVTWKSVAYSHTFPTNHNGATCINCHPGLNTTWTCFGCHNQTNITNKHKDVTGFTTNCITCHANGRKPGGAAIPGLASAPAPSSNPFFATVQALTAAIDEP